ncbi:MAG: hypothetical protein ABJ004_06315 [Cyclobacteriaceae bacterium]
MNFNNFDFYKKYPLMIPHVGVRYHSAKTRVLVLGESHYLPANSPAITPDDWYNGSEESLTKAEKEYIHTQGVISNHIQDKNWKGYNLFQNLGASFKKFEPYAQGNPFEQLAFYNYFLRPASHRISISQTKMDGQMAYDQFHQNIKILEPDLVIFSSVRASGSFQYNKKKRGDSDPSVKVDFVPHAGMAWWNRKTKRYEFEGDKKAHTGREKFELILGKYLK